jgi:arylsulfatase A-like enzyme/Tfp pilus assembly protein PilF
LKAEANRGGRGGRRGKSTQRSQRWPGRSWLSGAAKAGPLRLVAGAAAILGTLTFVVWFVRTRNAQADLRPIPGQNVLLITIDTLRADALGCYGGPAATPNLDRLARQGLRFDFAHAHAVVTLPSHTSILTGRYPLEHGIRDNTGYRLANGTPTMATLLKASGYRTGAFLGGFPLNARFGLTPGFDVYDDRVGESHGPVEFALAERRADAVVSAAGTWIASQSDHWFAWVHVFDPHAPYAPPAPFDRQYADRPYYGEVAYVDQAIERLLVQVRNQARPTLVVVTADHGEALGEHGEATHGLFAYESTLRVPLIIAEVDPVHPPRERDSISHAPVRHVDLLPTILDAVGAPVPAALPGRTLLKATEAGEVITSYFEALSASLNRGWAPLQGVLADREKFISLPLEELYDLSNDPREAANLAGHETERRRVLEARLSAWHPMAANVRTAEDAETVALLRALGYVSGTSAAKSRYTEEDDPKRLIELDAAIHRGIDLFEQGRVAESIDVYRQILERRPDMGIATSHLAFLYWQQGDSSAAIHTLQKALASGVTSSGLASQLGVYLAETGSARAALPLLQAAIARDSTDLDALNAIGIAYGHLGDAARAVETFRVILGRDPQNVMAYQNIATVDVQQGDLRAARDALERALAIDPRSARAYTGLGVIQLKEGRRDAAIESWKRAVELDPTEYDALFNLATELEHDGKRDAARPYLERFVRSAPAGQYSAEIRRLQALLSGR